MSLTRRTSVAQRVAAAFVGVLVALPLVAVALVATAAPANASTYRYWTYWWGADTGKSHSGWLFASQGPASHPLGDMWVLGWRFATSTTQGGEAPRASAGYASLCPGTSPVDNAVRIAVVLDYGTSADAPAGETPPSSSTVRRECLVIPTSPRPSGVTALNTAGVSVRTQNGLVCGLDGYPRSECAPVIADPAPTPTRTATPVPTRTATPAATAPSGGTTHTAAGTPDPSHASATATTSTGSPGTRTTASRSTSGTPSPSTSADGSAATSAEPSPGSGSGVPGPGSSPADTLPAVAGAPAALVQPSSSPLGVVAAGVVVAALVGSAWWTTRRRSSG